MAAPRSLAMVALFLINILASASASSIRSTLVHRLNYGLVGGYAALGVSVCAGAYFDDGFRRSLAFWGQAFPIYLHYEFVHQTTKNKTDEEIAAAFDKLHNFYAPIAKRICLDLRGFYLKTAQLASTITSTVPPQYMEWCTEMQDEVPTPFRKGQARMLVEEALECPLEDIFIDWSDEPCGSASIGQVHRARLKSNGKEVAIKIQYPGIEHKFRSDLKNIIRFCKLAMPQHVKPLREIEKQFLTEFDYKLEAQNLVEIERNLQKQWSDRVCVPKPILPLCKKTILELSITERFANHLEIKQKNHILTMEYLHGVPLLKGIEKRMEVLAKQQGRTLEDLEKDFRCCDFTGFTPKFFFRFSICILRHYKPTRKHVLLDEFVEIATARLMRLRMTAKEATVV
eukprot:jgi/Bigna1/79581/fgenesh1_pg.63_\